MSEEELYEDLDAVVAEAEGAPYRFRLRGQRWEIKHVQAFGRKNAELLRAFDGDNEAAMELVFSVGMGGPRYKEWQDQDPEIGVLAEVTVLNKWLKHCGLDAGKSEGSDSSSENTEEQSTPPSEPATPASTSASSSRASSRSGKRSSTSSTSRRAARSA